MAEDNLGSDWQSPGKGKRFNISADSEKCVGCRVCQTRCSFHLAGRFSFSDSAVGITWNPQQDRFEISFNVKCNACGRCVNSCLYGALVAEKTEEGHSRWRR